MSKSHLFAAFVLISLLHLCLSITSPNVTPTDWSESQYAFYCDLIGSPKIVEDQNTAVPLTAENIYLKTSYAFNQYIDSSGNQAFKQNIFKYYIQISSGGDGLFTSLSISLLSGQDGQPTTQTKMIQSTYEFIDANGPYVLLLQTIGGNVLLSLYSFDMTDGATALLQLSMTTLNTYPNQIFKSVQLYLANKVTGNLQTDPNYKDIIGTVVSINTQTTTTVVRQIISTGIDAILYTFNMNNVDSDVYTNLLLGLQIKGGNFYTYIAPKFGSGSTPPFTYANDQTDISTAGSLYSNSIVLPFIKSMLVVTYDDLGKNSNIFFLKDSKTNYCLTIEAVRTSTSTVSGGLQYLTDYNSYVIELNTDPLVSTFYIIWADDQNGYTYNFLNSVTDLKNTQIMRDFSNNPKISTYFEGAFNDDSTLSQILYVWVLSSNNMIKYTFTVQQDASSNVVSNTINKEFTACLNDNLLANQVGPNFQVFISLKCLCQTPQITEMVCFYKTDSCVLTVQTQPTFCVPDVPAP